MLEAGQRFIGQPPWYEQAMMSSRRYGATEGIALQGFDLTSTDASDITLDQMLAFSLAVRNWDTYFGVICRAMKE